MRILVPAGIAMLGLGTGLAAGLALKPAPVVMAGNVEACASGTGQPCPAKNADDRLEKITLKLKDPASPMAYVALD